MRHERRGLRGSTRPIHVHAHSTTGGTFPPLQRLHRAPFTAARPRARPMMPTPSGKEGSANTCGSPPLCQALATGECTYGIPRCVLGRVLEAVEAVIAHTRPSARHGVRLSSFTHVKIGQGSGRQTRSVCLCVGRAQTRRAVCLCGTVCWMPSRPAHFCPRSARAARSYLCRPWALLRVRNGRRPLFTSRVTNNEGHLP